MKLTIVSALLVLTAFSAARADVDAKQYEITNMKVREIQEVGSLGTSNGAAGLGSMDCTNVGEQHRLFANDGGAADVLNPINTVDLIVDKIINIGRKLWNIVEAGKPVSNLKADVATALPMGAKCWTDLQSWQMPQSKTYEVAFENGFGSEVVKMSYRVLWLPGGQANGVGSYIGYATIVPVDISVSWGFSMNANVSIPTVFNMGTKEAPVGAMQMNMQYRIESPFKTIDQGQAFVIDGRGNFKML